MDWQATSGNSDPDAEPDTPGRNRPAPDIDVSLQNHSLTLLALMAAHPMPHRALQRFRDLVEAWRSEPSEASLGRALQAPAGRFPMNIDQVVQLLIPPRSSIESRAADGVTATVARKVERRSVPRLGQAPWPPREHAHHDVWRAADSHQQMHDLFLMALLSTHAEPRRISGQFRALLERLARSSSDSALDPMSLVAVRRSAMRFDRIIQVVASAADESPVSAAVPDPEPAATRRPRAAAARAVRSNVRTQAPRTQPLGSSSSSRDA
jgi:hypothetical protein